MADMEYSFDHKKWFPVYKDMPLNSTIPGGATQVYFRQKPQWSYQVNWSGTDGSFGENYEDMTPALRKVSELQHEGRNCNLYVRNLSN